MNNSNQLLYIIFSTFGVGGISWVAWVTLKLVRVHSSLVTLNNNLYLIDWEKLPKKNLNKIIKPEV